MPLTVVRGDDEETIEVSVTEYGLHFPFYIFDPPSALWGSITQGMQVRQVRTIVIGQSDRAVRTLDDLKRDLGATDVRQSHTAEPGQWARMLAKIALGFGVARVGLDGFESIHVRDMILGNSDDTGTWVGNLPPRHVEVGPDQRHRIELAVAPARRLLVRVQLLADYAGPEYAVVVGTLTPPAIASIVGGNPK